MKFLFKLIAKNKVYLSRAMFYASMLNTAMLVLITKDKYIPEIHGLLILFFGGIIVILVGYIDHTYVFKHEAKHINSKNDLKHDMIRIEKKLDKLIDAKNTKSEPYKKGKEALRRLRNSKLF